MQSAYLITKIIHIVAGSLALLAGLGAILLRHNTKKHRPFGTVYFWCMTVIFVTSCAMATYRFNLFLLFIGIFTYHSSLTALRSLKLRQLHQGQQALPVDWVIEALNLAANAGLVIFGIYYALNYSVQGGSISVAFGCIGINNSRLNVKRLRGKVHYANYWLLAHISGMLGSYIGAITAFTVNNNRWMNLPEVVAWLGPTVVLVPLLVRETARFKQQTLPEAK